ncbi:MAG: [acyl-carrier-protein] S-malonyltransferase, partial [Thermacetogenium sp.]|nr:[acyl-carrier-protein] S-malonyltransferase [Thermacetogenium sp.]
MLRLAFVFPGQGAQFVGMGKDLAEEFNEVRKVYDLADEVMGFPLSKICFEGPPEVLNKTEITQPAVLTTSIAIYELLRDHGINPVMAAGLSLGEYSALVSSGVLRFEDALRIVSRRGRIMQEAVPEGKGMMAAVLGLDNATIERTCQE